MIGLACVLFLDLGSTHRAAVVGGRSAGAWCWVALFVVACAWWTPHPRVASPGWRSTGLVIWVLVDVGVSLGLTR